MTKSLRLALFSDSAPQLFERALLSSAERAHLTLELHTWAFTSPLAVQAELEQFHPDRILLWVTPEAARFPEIETLLSLPYDFIVTTMGIRDDGIFGHLALTRPDSLRARIEAWNAHLVTLAKSHPHLELLDVTALQATLGYAQTFDARLWEIAGIALTPKATDAMADALLKLLAAQYGDIRKILVTDLDNTLWQGIISEDGVTGICPDAPGFATYQKWLKALASRGVLLAIASKNTPEAITAALCHPANILKEEDFSAIVSGWESKASLIQCITDTLHLHPSSVVFCDDDANERAEVRACLPEVCVPELPTDATLRTPFLAQQNLFEVASLTADDLLRAQSLHADTLRQKHAHHLSTAEYITSLEQVLTPIPLTPETYERAAQLTQRCNQFNMRGNRFTAADLQGRTGWVYHLKDRFGELGIISAVILKGYEIDAWVISCRALNRDIESLILNHLKSLHPICGTYTPTERNAYCAAIYQTHGIPATC